MSTFDVVLVDTPAAPLGTDAMMLARAAGAALMVARTNVTRMTEFSDAVEAMKDAGVNVVGSVLVNVPAHKNASLVASEA
jgi:Mrp family chromosome partitioning ATPase